MHYMLAQFRWFVLNVFLQIWILVLVMILVRFIAFRLGHFGIFH